MRLLGLISSFLAVSFFTCGSPDQVTLENGTYQTNDANIRAVVDLSRKTLLLYLGSLPETVDTIVIGSKFIINGCPTNFSHSCEIQCYKLLVETLRLGEIEIPDPVIGPGGNSNIIICMQPDGSTTGGAGLSGDRDSTKYIELWKE